MASEVAVIHLVWAPLGSGMLEGFLASYRERPPGLAHRLVVILNGFDGPADAKRGTCPRWRCRDRPS